MKLLLRFASGLSWPARVALAMLCLVVLLALAAPLLPLKDPYATDLAARSALPAWTQEGSAAHLLGTDPAGRDVLSRLVYGARTSLAIGVSVTVVACFIGVALGVVAGYFGGWVDAVVSFVVTARLALPVVLVCLASVALFGASFAVIIVVLGALLWDRFALVTRSLARQVSRNDYVTAARLHGASTARVILREVMPALAPHLVVVATLEVGLAIVLESALSFLGMGVPPPIASWGLMIAEGKEELLFNPWLVVLPSLALFLLVMCINVLGDALQQGDPREIG